MVLIATLSTLTLLLIYITVLVTRCVGVSMVPTVL